jgi:hypothetical protein
MTDDSMHYLCGIPRKPLPPGQVVVHNHVQPPSADEIAEADDGLCALTESGCTVSGSGGKTPPGTPTRPACPATWS